MRSRKQQGTETGVYYLWNNYLHRMFGSFVFDVDWDNVALEDFDHRPKTESNNNKIHLKKINSI